MIRFLPQSLKYHLCIYYLKYSFEHKEGDLLYDIIDLCIQRHMDDVIEWLCMATGGVHLIYAYYGHDELPTWITKIIHQHGHHRAILELQAGGPDIYLYKLYFYRALLGIPYPKGSERVPMDNLKYDRLHHVYNVWR